MIPGPNNNLAGEPGNGSAPEMIYYFPYFANTLILQGGGWMKVPISGGVSILCVGEITAAGSLFTRQLAARNVVNIQ